DRSVIILTGNSAKR
ncbi:hypothetical protein V3C99_008279, partial [Haemonchus contortus]